ncbi:hypothetical protein X760_31325 [Mesorhizobium sp. LSHC422A00]|nr:hypothetical protein X760_31325 [Mesorhizobium sp. LSHC422A00]
MTAAAEPLGDALRLGEVAWAWQESSTATDPCQEACWKAEG